MVKEMASQENKSLSNSRFSLEEVIAETDEVLINELRAELPKKPLRSGADIRINALKTLICLIESQNKKLSQIQDVLVEIRNERGVQK